MPLIPDPVLDDVQARTDIVELIGKYVPLQRAGRHFKALCPFHQERTPSFHVNTDKQIFHCFGCGAGGNVFGFLMRQERLTFPEAVARLAQETGVRLPDSAQREQTDELYGVLEKACRFYERFLADPKRGRDARRYIEGRGVNERARQTFRIGLAPESWEQLARASRRSGVPAELLHRAGLTTQGGRGPVDRFRNRLMFPIQDARGRVVSFGGRSLGGQHPKYLNGPETPVYQKGRHLFGLAQAKEAIVQAKSVIVVEGYVDCVMLWQAGFEHVVSPLGTAFTPDQANLLSRYTDRVILAFDPDLAGETATLRGIDILLEAGLYVQVAQLPPGVDPDELVQQSGPEAFRERIAKSLNVVEFLIARARRLYPVSTAEGKARAAQAVLPTLAKVPSAILRAEYARALATALDLPERAVAGEIGRWQPRAARPAATPGPSQTRVEPQGAERVLTALVIDEPSRLDRLGDARVSESFYDARLARVLSVVASLRHGSVVPSAAQVISRLEEEHLGPLVSELVQLAQSVSSKERAFQECIQRIQADARKRQLAALREQMRAAEADGRTETSAQLLDEYQRLAKGRLPVGRQGGGTSA